MAEILYMIEPLKIPNTYAEEEKNAYMIAKT